MTMTTNGTKPGILGTIVVIVVFAVALGSMVAVWRTDAPQKPAATAPAKK